MSSQKSSFQRGSFEYRTQNDDINEKFLEACCSGDDQLISLILCSIKDFDIDITDNLGRTALRLAILNNNIEIVELLLQKCDSTKVREALLLAIYMGHTQLAENIINHPQYKIFHEKKFLNGTNDSFWQTTSSDNAQFSPDMTPIMLASQYNRIEIVQLLLSNGEFIEKPHEFHCKCIECSNRFKFDSLRHAQSRLNAYRGLTSPCYISLASVDPILSAFEMRHEIRILSEKEKYFKEEYLQLADKLSEYSVNLVNNVRGRDELDILLNKTGREDEEKYGKLARLGMAIKYEEMGFVAHPNCQQKLVEVWYTGVRKIRHFHKVLIILLIIAFIFFIPFGSMIFIILPRSKFGKFMSLPCIKFLTFTISYILFISMLIYNGIQFDNEEKSRLKFSQTYPEQFENFTQYFEADLKIKFEARDFYIRKSQPNNLDLAICIWLLGLFLREVKNIIDHGPNEYLFLWSNIISWVMILIFFSSYGLKLYTILIVRQNLERVCDPLFWSLVSNLNNSNLASQINVYKTFYWLNNDRFYWVSFDPINLAEGLFAFGIIASFSRLCFLLPTNQSLGPLQITLGHMITDIFKFLCIFSLVFSGFLFGLHNLYWYYETGVRKNVEITKHDFKTIGEQKFGTLSDTFITMFYSLYALGGSDDVLIEPFENSMTPKFGYALFGMFHVSNITILMSMLIAMMTKSFQTILEQSDTEWKYSRSRLYMEFIKRGSVVPIPLNIIPSPNFVLTVFKKIIGFLTTSVDMNEAPVIYINELDQRELSTVSKSSDGDVVLRKHSTHGTELNYKKVIERIVRRFLLNNSENENEPVKEKDFDELNQDLKSAKTEILTDILKTKENVLENTTILQRDLRLLGEFFIGDDSGLKIENKF
ncbi:unnamed protein product [Brachionus calyciflorus]|uniref:Transient receptor ion channel domain-containing protein n=1 Tax=Brachionus calyciflorus TaxID=104777 RepID=A0A813M740_9BILA|nr:unnamed protein product [Brachionus calyciflorus]